MFTETCRHTSNTSATLGKEQFEIGPGQALHVPPNVPHSLTVLEDAEVISAKSIVGGAGHRI